MWKHVIFRIIFIYKYACSQTRRCYMPVELFYLLYNFSNIHLLFNWISSFTFCNYWRKFLWTTNINNQIKNFASLCINQPATGVIKIVNHFTVYNFKNTWNTHVIQRILYFMCLKNWLIMCSVKMRLTLLPIDFIHQNTYRNPII